MAADAGRFEAAPIDCHTDLLRMAAHILRKSSAPRREPRARDKARRDDA